MKTTEINIYPEDSPIRPLARARIERLSRLFSYGIKDELNALLDELEILGGGVEIDKDAKSIKIFFKLG